MYKKLLLLVVTLSFFCIPISAVDSVKSHVIGYKLLNELRGGNIPIRQPYVKISKERIKELIDSGEDLNFIDNSCYYKDRTALTWAVCRGYDKEIIKLLVDAGSDVNKAFDNNYLMVRHKSIDILKILVQAGADINKCSPGNDGDTVLSCAIICNSLELFEFLLASGAHYNIRNKSCGRTPLMVAMVNEEHDIMRLLLEVGCYLDEKDIQIFLKNLPQRRFEEIYNQYSRIYNQYCNDCKEISYNLVQNNYGLDLPDDIVNLIGLYLNLKPIQVYPKIKDTPKVTIKRLEEISYEKNNLYNINSLEMRPLIAEFAKNQKLINKEEENYNKCLIM